MAQRGRRSQSTRLSQLAGFNSTRQTETVLAQLEKRVSSKLVANNHAGQNVHDDRHMFSAEFSAVVDEPTTRLSPQSLFSGDGQELSEPEHTTERTTAMPMPAEISDSNETRRDLNSTSPDSLSARAMDDATASDFSPKNAGAAAAENAISVGHLAATLHVATRVGERRKQRQSIRPSHHAFRKSVRKVSEEAKEGNVNKEVKEAKDIKQAKKTERDEADKPKDDAEVEDVQEDPRAVQDSSSWLGLSNIMGTDAAPSREFEVPQENTWFSNFSNIMGTNAAPSREFEEFEEEAPQESTWFSNFSNIMGTNAAPSREFEEYEEEAPQESMWFSKLGRRMSGLVGVAALSPSGLSKDLNWEDERDRMLGLQTKKEKEREKQVAADIIKKIQEDVLARVQEELEEREQSLRQMEESAVEEGNMDNGELQHQIDLERVALQRVTEARISEQTLQQLQVVAQESNMGDAGKAELQSQIEEQRVVVEQKQQEYEREFIAEREREEILINQDEYDLELRMRDSELLMYSTAVFDRERLLCANRRVRRNTWNSKWALMALQDQEEREHRLQRVQSTMARHHVLQPSFLALHKARLARSVQAAQDAHHTECWRLREILLYRRQDLLTSAEAEAAEAAWERAMWSLRHKLEAALRSIAECEVVRMRPLSETPPKESLAIPSERTKLAVLGTQSEDNSLHTELEGVPSTPGFGSTEQHEANTPFYQRKDVLAQAYLRKLEAQVPPNHTFMRPQLGVPSGSDS